MAIWPGMLLSPTLFLGYLSLAYALVPFACSSQRHGVLHAVSAGVTVLMLAGLASGWRSWQRSRATQPDRSADASATRRRFLAGCELAIGALSLLATLALWFTQFVIPPCAG